MRRSVLTPLEEIARYSAESDRVFIGPRPPELDESSESSAISENPVAYSACYRETLESTAKFPSP